MGNLLGVAATNASKKKETASFLFQLAKTMLGFSLMLLITQVIAKRMLVDKTNFNFKLKDASTDKNRALEQFWAGKMPEDAEEIITLIKYPEVYQRFGSHTPGGVLLVGPPGTGKTHYARALAWITDAKFLYASAAQFDEVYVGRGAQRVRALFDQAEKHTTATFTERLWSTVTGKATVKPNQKCIIFVDELDSLGTRNRMDNRTQTLSQMLTCMDGLSRRNPNIFVLAATNDVTKVDSALLRSGRFDRIINMPMPNVSTRTELIDFYLQKKPGYATLKSENMFEVFAKCTRGFNCGDLKSMTNEACIRAAREAIARQEGRDVVQEVKQVQLDGEDAIVQVENQETVRGIHLLQAFIAVYKKVYSERKANALLSRSQLLSIVEKSKPDWLQLLNAQYK